MALVRACKENDKAMVTRALLDGADPNATDDAPTESGVVTEKAPAATYEPNVMMQSMGKEMSNMAADPTRENHVAQLSALSIACANRSLTVVKELVEAKTLPEQVLAVLPNRRIPVNKSVGHAKCAAPLSMQDEPSSPMYLAR